MKAKDMIEQSSRPRPDRAPSTRPPMMLDIHVHRRYDAGNGFVQHQLRDGAMHEVTAELDGVEVEGSPFDNVNAAIQGARNMVRAMRTRRERGE